MPLASKKIVMVAGEASGDIYGASLADSLMKKRDGLTISGIGGIRMRDAGVRLIYDIKKISVVGISEVIRQLKNIREAYNLICNFIETEKADLVILIDFPDFNLRLASFAKSKGIKVIYYISPQIWAWRSSRLKRIATDVDKMIVILPFEKEIYERAGINCDFVGHPLLDEVKENFDKDLLCSEYKLDSNRPIVGILPGSRISAIRALLPIMLKSLLLIKNLYPNIQFVIAIAPTIEDEVIQKYIKDYPPIFKLISGKSNEAIFISDYILTASGTSTLQTAIIGRPMVIIYKISFFTYFIGRLLIHIKNIGLVNIIAKKEICPEHIQYKATPENISQSLSKMIEDKEYVNNIKKDLSMVKMSLGEKGASNRVAEKILAYI